MEIDNKSMNYIYCGIKNIGPSVLMSIKPTYTERIINGTKLYEYRKSIFESWPDVIYIYESYPIKRIVASFKPNVIMISTPVNIWAKTNRYGGIDRNAFFNYFEGHYEAWAIGIDSLHVFERPVALSEINENFRAPQSFCYLTKEQTNLINLHSKYNEKWLPLE